MRSKPGSQPYQNFETSHIFTLGAGKIGGLTQLCLVLYADIGGEFDIPCAMTAGKSRTAQPPQRPVERSFSLRHAYSGTIR